MEGTHLPAHAHKRTFSALQGFFKEHLKCKNSQNHDLHDSCCEEIFRESKTGVFYFHYLCGTLHLFVTFGAFRCFLFFFNVLDAIDTAQLRYVTRYTDDVALALKSPYMARKRTANERFSQAPLVGRKRTRVSGTTTFVRGRGESVSETMSRVACPIWTRKGKWSERRHVWQDGAVSAVPVITCSFIRQTRYLVRHMS